MKRYIILTAVLALLAPAFLSARPPHVSHGGGQHYSGGGHATIHHVPSFSGVAPRQVQPQVTIPRQHVTAGTRIGPNIAVGNGRAALVTGRGGDPARNWNTAWSNRPYYAYHRGWHQGHWGYWGGIPLFWLGASALGGGWLLPPGESLAYSNPYYAAPDMTYELPVPDYSTPIPVPDGGGTTYSEEDVQPPDLQDFDSARDAFRKGDYATALSLINRALGKTAGDVAMHEFRALTLFAMGMYRDAAAGIYAVLSAGPGWNRDTLMALYPDADAYTRQLRTLEKYARDNPRSAEARFVLAYHYLTLDRRDQAIQELREVGQLQPGNVLARELLKALTTQTESAPADRE